MRISLITVCRNVAPVIAETLDSVFAQDHRDIEVIVIDGASTDGTVEVLERYRSKRKPPQGLPTKEGTPKPPQGLPTKEGTPKPPQGLPTKEGTLRDTTPGAAGSLSGDPAEGRGIDVLVSEPDKGIYDAMNKGLRQATGDIIGFVNAGDLLMTPSVLTQVVDAFNRTKADAVYGDIIMVDEQDITKVKRVWKSGDFRREHFRSGWMPPHVATFFRKSVYDRFGLFRDDLRIGADYEILLRFLYKEKVPTVHLPEILVRFRLGGMSNGTVQQVLQANREVRRSWRLNGLNAPPLLVTRKLWSKVLQFFH